MFTSQLAELLELKIWYEQAIAVLEAFWRICLLSLNRTWTATNLNFSSCASHEQLYVNYAEVRLCSTQWEHSTNKVPECLHCNIFKQINLGWPWTSEIFHRRKIYWLLAYIQSRPPKNLAHLVQYCTFQLTHMLIYLLFGVRDTFPGSEISHELKPWTCFRLVQYIQPEILHGEESFQYLTRCIYTMQRRKRKRVYRNALLFVKKTLAKKYSRESITFRTHQIQLKHEKNFTRILGINWIFTASTLVSLTVNQKACNS